MPLTNAHERYMRVLFDHVARERFPSGEMLDRIEILLDEDHVDEYVDLLFERLESQRYPSKILLDRVARWTLAAN